MYDTQLEIWRQRAEIAVYNAIKGRIHPAIIRQSTSSNIIVLDLTKDCEMNSCKGRKEYYVGYLVVTYTVGEFPHFYPSIDKHYVRRASALARYRDLGGSKL